MPSSDPHHSSPTPRTVSGRLLERISAGRWDDLAELYAPDVEVEFPFAPVPPHRLRGREALRERFAALRHPDAPRLRAENIRIRDTDDPELVVAEFDYEVHLPATGRTFRTANVQVLRVRDGLIVESRDYHDHLAFATAAGRAADLLTALGG
ncbi:nuclear transport factor 2 family protein [Kitasatospora sp. NPDC048365]|uniref:nuclear transport factor 2 family protein n=1 Tax=Kitasatospora sp. NPDC048365 TaxID=3364050 RepID=UPI00371F7460